MAEFIVGVAAPLLFLIAVVAWFLILVGSVAAVALVYWIRDTWKKR